MSGHGFSDAVTKEGFFCAANTDPRELVKTGLSLEEVRKRMLASPARQRLLIVDACRNQAGQRNADQRLEVSAAFRAEGLGVLLSTAPGSVSRPQSRRPFRTSLPRRCRRYARHRASKPWQ